jgi:hypothetical protein
MKNQLSFGVIALFLCTASASAQTSGTFTFQVVDFKGQPIGNAYLIVLNGEQHFTDASGFLVYTGEKNYTTKGGKMEEVREMPLYITAKAPGYQDRTIDLTQYTLGSYVPITLTKRDALSTDYKSISVYVKDANGQPISGASVLVSPGKSTATDAGGYAEALHTHLISGEWVTIEVYKEGYKIQRQYIPSGDAPRVEGGRQIPAATAYFTLEKGENVTNVFHVNVEVLDYATDEAVPGASVQLSLSDGTVMKGTTNAMGECRFSDVEYGFSGTTARVTVTKTGYDEKWSDITSDLMTGQDNAERQYLVYLKKETVCWPGSYAQFDPVTQQTLCYCYPGLEWNSTKTACIDPRKAEVGCTQADAATFSRMTGSWKAYRMHVTLGGSCDNVTGTWKVTEWCEGVDATYNASVARVNGTLTGKMVNGYLQLSFESPPSPNNSVGTKGTGSCTLRDDGTLSCSGFGCNSDPLTRQ